MDEPRFFKSQREWRAWLEKNHARVDALVVGFHKVKSDEKGITYKQALDEALCFGWIDGRRNGGDRTWTIRFSKRKARSIWSQVNIKRMEELKAAGLVHASGLAVYEKRDPKLQNRYSFENRHVDLAPDYARQFRSNRKAWANFEKMIPSYRRPAIWWVMSARQEATRERRLAALIVASEKNERVKPLQPPARKT